MKLLITLVLICAGSAVMGRPPHYKNDGVRLASEIVGLVGDVLAPSPKVVVVKQTPPPPPRVVVKHVPPPPPRVVVKHVPPPPPPRVIVPNYGYGWYKGLWVPTYNGWYYYNTSWCWGGRGPAPRPPRWTPDFRRAAPPPPPRHHHRPAPPPRRYAPPRHHRPAPPPPPPQRGGHRR